MRPEGVVLPTPAFSQALSLSHSGEKLGVQELILEFAVERFSKVALQRVSRIDASRGVSSDIENCTTSDTEK